MKRRMIWFVLLFLIVGLNHTLYASERRNIDMHGFISQGYLKTNRNNYLAETEDGTFQFNEMGINFSTDLTDLLHIGMQLFARDLGAVSNDNVVLDWAYADYRWKNWLGVRMGKVKIDFGLYNEIRGMDMLRTDVMLPQSVYPEMWRNSYSSIKGLAVYGYLPLSSFGKLAYDLQVGAMEFKQDTGFMSSFGGRIFPGYDITNIDSDYAWFGNLKWDTPLPGLVLKATYYDIKGQKTSGNIAYQQSPDPNNPWNPDFMWDTNYITEISVDLEFNKRDGYVLSLEYTWDNLIFVAEYTREDFPSTMMPPPPPGSIPIYGGGFGQPGFKPPKPPESSEGWYVSGSYRFTDWFELGLGYLEFYPDAKDKHGNNAKVWGTPVFCSWLKSYTLSTRFDINDYWILKLETSYNNGLGGINQINSFHEIDPFNYYTGLDQYWMLYAAKVTFSF